MAKKKAATNSPSHPSAASTTSPNPELQRMLTAAHATKIDRSKISAAAYNPRQISPSARKKLSKSLSRFGLVEPLVWNQRTGNLVGGHQRLAEIDRVAKSLDYQIEVSCIDVDDATERAINLSLNNLEMQGQYDAGLLAEIATDLSRKDQSLLDSAGFDEKSLHVLLGDDFVPSWARQQKEAEAPVIAQLSEMYQAGREHDKAVYGPQESDDADEDADESDEDYMNQDAENEQRQFDEEEFAESDERAHREMMDEATGADDLPSPNQQLAEKRRAFKESTVEEDNADVLLSIHAANTAELERLLQKLGIDPGERYVAASIILDALK